jgi:hypothetical protein
MIAIAHGQPITCLARTIRFSHKTLFPEILTELIYWTGRFVYVELELVDSDVLARVR